MKIIVALTICLVLPASAFAQSPSKSVWIQDYTAQEIIAKVSGGMTTLLYVGGATHSDGPSIAVGKHVLVAREVGRRIAEELGNALVLPINPYAEQHGQMAHISPQSGPFVGGTIHLSPETHALLLKDIVSNSLIALRGSEGLVGTGYKHVMIMGDHTQGIETLQRVAQDLDREWKPKGVRVFYIDEGLSGKALMEEHLTKLNRNLPRATMTAVDDAAELMAVDPERRWIRVENIPASWRDLITPQLGKLFIDFKVNSALQQIRKLMAGGATP